MIYYHIFFMTENEVDPNLDYWNVALSFRGSDPERIEHGACIIFEKRYMSEKLRKLWAHAGRSNLDILYQGPDREEALKSIEGLERIGEEALRKKFGVF
jgi:hypothetical protein